MRGMGQPKEKPTVDQVLSLVQELTPEEREQVREELNLQEIRRRLEQAEESIARGEGIPAEEAFAQLEARYQQRKANA